MGLVLKNKTEITELNQVTRRTKLASKLCRDCSRGASAVRNEEMAAAGRRLPSSLATYARECSLFRSGQRCATCPEAATAACPIRDIEDVPAHLLSRARARTLSTDVVHAGDEAVMRCHRATGICAAGAGTVPCRGLSAAAVALPASKPWGGDASPPSAVLSVLVERQPASPLSTVTDKGEPLSSKAGRAMFQEALAADTLGSYFTLSEQMVYQPDPSVRPVTCLAVVLNALRHDPYKTWKPIWRWNTEEVILDQEGGRRGLTAERVRSNGGLKLHEFAELARNNGARAQAYPACPTAPFASPALLSGSRPNGEDSFRQRVKAVCSQAEGEMEEHVVVRRFSPAGQWALAPVAGYHTGSDCVLLLDLDRAAAPRWVRLEALWADMCSTAGGSVGGFVAVGAMSSELSTSSASAPAGCPRLLRSWGEGKLVVEPVSEAPMMALEERVTKQGAAEEAKSFGELCPLVVWAAATRSQPITRRCGSHTKRLSRSAMRRGSAAGKTRARDGADARRDNAVWLLQWCAGQQGAQDVAMAGWRSVHSSRAHAVAPALRQRNPVLAGDSDRDDAAV